MPELKPLLYGPDGSPVTYIQRGGPITDPGFFLRSAFRSTDLSQKIKDEPYAKHPPVYACVNAITMNLARLPKFLSDTHKPDKITREHPFLMLLNRPNELMNGTKLWEMTLLSLLLPTVKSPGGQCFWVGIGKNGENYDFQSSRDLPYQLFAFNDRMFSAIKDEETGNLWGWRMQLPRGGGVTFTTNEVLRFNFINPYNLFLGLSPLSAAEYALLTDAKATELNCYFFDNNASLGGVLSTTQNMSNDNALDMAKMWRQEYSGATKAGKIAVLHSGLEYQQIEGSHADMQYIEQKKLNREDVMMVYRVPKAELALYEDMNYATAQSADKSFWEKTLKPIDELILSTCNNGWLRFFEGNKFKLLSDYSGIECLNANYTQLISQMKDLVGLNIPVAEAARLLKIPIDVSSYPWLNTVFVQGNLVTAEAITDSPLISSIPETTTPASKAISANKLIPKYLKKEEKKLGLIALLEKDIEEKKKWVEEYFKRAVDPIESSYRKVLSKYFVKQRNKILDNIDAYFKNKKAIVKDFGDIESNPDIFWENLKSEDEILRGISEDFFDKAIKAQAKEMKDEIGELGNWEIDSESMTKFKEARLESLKEIWKTTKRAGRKQILGALKDLPPDATVQDAAKAIKKSAEGMFTIRNAQAKTIARTEIGVIASGTRYDIMKEEGIEKHEWVAVLDDVTRESHIEMNGKVVNVGDEFPNGLTYPLEDGAPAEEVINCRCVALPFQDGDHV